MRATGRTTRAVDSAIQKLFTHGMVHLCTTGLDKRGYTREYIDNICITDNEEMDEDSQQRLIRQHLLRRVLIRLHTEHPKLKYEIDENRGDGIIIKLVK